MISTFRSKLWVLKAIEAFNFIKGIDDMFNFFTDIKNRLTALEQHIETIYAHLRAAKVEAEAVPAEVTQETPKDAA